MVLFKRWAKEEFFVRVGEEELQEKLLPYVFFEHLLFGGNYEAFLSDELLPDKEKIKGFIGDFVGVHLTEDLSCALLRRKKENLYEAVYFGVEIKDGKICDIKG